MKTLKVFPLFLLVLIGLSCNRNENDVAFETVKINILPTVEINQDVYTPLRSTIAEDSIVYAVQIYEGEVPIYYGLFNDISKMEIVLTTNKNYKLKVAAYQDGSGSVLKTLIQNGVTKYYLPDTVSLLNKFVLGDRLSGISDVSNAKLKNNNHSLYPEIDVFYQEIETTVTKGMSSLDIPLKRTGFGLGISVDGLSTGNIEVYFAGDTIHLTPSVKSYFSIRSFIGDTKGLADVAMVDTYFVNTNITVKWTGNNGSVVAASKVIKLKRNYQLPLYINFNSTNTGITIENWQNDIKDSIGNNTTVTDIDGNVYGTVTIGTQVWMAENLRTTKYNDGTSIPNVTTISSWTTSLKTAAFCWQKNDILYKNPYGGLYNWYAVNTGELAPKGWHVSTDADWTTLATYLGGDSIAGGKLKEVGSDHWTSPNLFATDNFGFSAVPNGTLQFGSFGEFGNQAAFVTSTSNGANAWLRVIYHDEKGITKFAYNYSTGFSVRCIKD